MICLSVLSRLRKIAGRSRRSEHMLHAIRVQLTRVENIVSDILAKLEALKSQADAFTTDQGKRIAEAVAAARAAQASEDKAAASAEMEAALAKIDEISKALVTFTPSGN